MARTTGVEAGLLNAVIAVESAYNPRAVSPKGALGLAQMMPATARAYGVSDALRPADNLRASLLEPAILRRLSLLNHCLDALGHLADDAKVVAQVLERAVQLFQLRPQAEYAGLEVALKCER